MHYLGQSEFEKKMNAAAVAQNILYETDFTNFDLVDDSTIKYDGKLISISTKAFKDYIEILKIPKKFLERFEESFGKDGRANFIKVLKEAHAGAKNAKVTLVANQKRHEIVAIRPGNVKLISNEECLRHASGIIDQFDLKVVDFSISEDGDISVSTISPKSSSNIKSLGPDEEFNSGLTFNNNGHRGYEVLPYLNRLACANGAIFRKVHGYKETYWIKNMDPATLDNFHKEMVSLSANNFIPEDIHHRIERAATTQASLDEVNNAVKLLLTKSKVKYEDLQRWIQIDRINNEYNRFGIDTAKLDTHKMKNAKTDITVWSLVNKLTDIASHNYPEFSKFDDYSKKMVQISAGDLLLKKTYDTENLIKSPFQ